MPLNLDLNLTVNPTRRRSMRAVPGLAFIATALSLQLVGDGVRDLLDTRLKRAM